MEFGKLKDISKVDFQLPDDAPGTTNLLNSLPQRVEKPLVYIGCTGWSMKEWVGKVYPTGAKPADFLKHYATQFNTIELNTTHYRIPTLEIIRSWKSNTPPDFRFCPKVPQVISHSSDLDGEGSNVQAFCKTILGLEGNLGCCFLQLPPYFGANKLGLLESFIKKFPHGVPLAIELRHESWFEDQQVFDLFENHNISTVITDVAGRRDVLHQRLTNGTVLIRFVGNDLHPTDFKRIDHWVARLKKWLENGLSNVYFFTHEPDNLLAPDLALYLFQQIEKKCQAITRGPDLDIHRGGEQISLF